MSAVDRLAVNDLLVGYFRGFDERRTDDAFLRETFTADAHWRFPLGHATGIEEIIDRREGTLGLWKQTLHSVSSVLIERDGDRAKFTASSEARLRLTGKTRSLARLVAAAPRLRDPTWVSDEFASPTGSYNRTRDPAGRRRRVDTHA